MKLYATLLIAASSAIIASCSSSSAEKDSLTLSGLDPQKFTTEINGKSTALYTLRNHAGMEACITNYGGRVVSLLVPDRDGKPTDVVLGHDNIDDYINIDGNFGALIGRYGNRIANGCFTLNDSTYRLPVNNYGHSLHGGPVGFHHALWDASMPNDSTLVLKLFSPDGDAGYPGNINVSVVYSLRPDNALAINYEATTDRPTILNLTNHSYFNLSGDLASDILDQEVYINADAFTPIDSTFMTDGEIRPVDGTPFDFRQPKPVGRDILADDIQLRNGLGYDHNFVLNTAGDSTAVAASVYSPATGITMNVYTDEPGLQFYAGNFLDGTVKGKNGIAYPYRGAIVMETQHYPNSPNIPQWPSTIITPDSTYHSTCIYRFTTE
ncbi:MAG: galactose mutarotase [Muribaculaceae bacterium]|nr:galactose mutarotase [Muribaculaceae bacterium]